MVGRGSLSLVVLLVAAALRGQESPTTLLTARLDGAVRAAAGDRWFGAVLVARDGEVLLRCGYGDAVAGRAIDATTLFDVASIGKQFTAAAVLRLESRGRLSLDDRVERWFRAPDDKARITLRHLLTHVSGLPRDVELDESERATRSAALERVWAEPLVNRPGDVWEYSNAGYLVLAAVIERVSGRRLADFLRREVFVPAGMRDTGTVGAVWLDRERAAPRWEERPDPRYDDTAVEWPAHWGFHGAAGIVSTVDDLFRWDRALHGGDVLSEAAKAKLFAPAERGYALGWEVSRTPRRTAQHGHTGRCYGFHSVFLRFPDEDACVIVLGNTEARISLLADDLARVLFAAPTDPRLVAAVAGTYPLPSGGGQFDVIDRDGALVLRAVGPEAVARLLHGRTLARGDELNRHGFAKRAVALMRPLVDGESDAFARSFDPSAPREAIARALAEWQQCVEELGPCRDVSLIGSDARIDTSWLDARFGDTNVRWRATWRGPRRLASFARDDDPIHPFETELRWRRGRVFGARSDRGWVDVSTEFIDGARGLDLLWSDHEPARFARGRSSR